MKIFVLSIIAAISLSQAANAISEIKLVDDGKPNAVIVVGSDASEPERTAANELASYLKKSTGADFNVTDTMPAAGNRILIGQTAYAKQALNGFDWSSLKNDGIVIKTVGNDLVIAGDRPRGSIYAVVTFLEDQLGIRWWAPDAETVPKHRNVSIKPLDVVYKPPFMYREAFFQAANMDNADFPMHLKLNGHHQRIPAEKGNHYSILGWCHTFYQLLPPDKYFADHPDWYAEINGKRTADWTQLCLTNDDMKQEMVKQALAWIDKNPEAGIISISQNDWYGPCQCPKCSELVKKTGSQSGALITFVNSVAEEIEKKYPDFLIETLAYQYTRQAPTGVKPRKNVIVRLCSIECNFAQPLESKANEAFYNDLKSWKQIANRLYIWDYIVNFSNFFVPHPNFNALAPNIRTFANNNVIGLFEQGDAYNPNVALNPLKTWMVAKLMWNPASDEKALTKEFINGYFGKAGRYMEQYLGVLTNAVDREKPNLGCFAGTPSYYTVDDLTKANSAMNKAVETVKDDPVLLRRVKIQQLALYNLLITTKRGFAFKGQEVKGVDWEKIVKEFLDLSDATGNIYSNEGVAMSTDYRKMLLKSILPIPAARKPAPPTPGTQGVDWVDLQENQFRLFGEGLWVVVDNDEAASNGITSSMPGSSTQWAVQHSFTAKEIIAPKVDVIARIKVDAKDKSGNAIDLGVYDPDTSAHHRLYVPVADVKGDGYNEYRLNGIALKPGMYVYVAPCGNGSVNSISVDRIYLVKSAEK